MDLLRRIWTIVELVRLVIVDWLTDRIGHFNLGLRGLHDIPAIPFKLRLIRTLGSLAKRNTQTKQSVQGLSTVHTIGKWTLPAHAYLWGDDEVESAEHRGDRSAQAREELQKRLRNPLAMANYIAETMEDADVLYDGPYDDSAPNQLCLEKPEQFSMAWTTFPDVYGQSQDKLEAFSATLTDADEASRAFWTTISEYGQPYNLIFTQKLDEESAAGLAGTFGDAWGDELNTLQAAGRLYAIDLRIFEMCPPQRTEGGERIAPASVTVLRQDETTKALEPVLIRVSGFEGKGATVYARGQATDDAWLYALQAAKASVGTYGIWLGHVYYWHVPTAAVQMTMYNCLPEDHALYKLLHPQSQYLIEFDTLLLLLWSKIAPPTAITTAAKFLKLENAFAGGRTFFDDDPPTNLENLGLREEDFSHEEPWDQYRFVGNLLKLWEITGDYVREVVDALYPDDQKVRSDAALQKWARETGDPDQGNIRGLPPMDSRHALRKFLHSYLYRITAHGSSRLPDAANPGLTFVSNFPPCLQRSDIPSADAEISTRELLTYLPNTGTIGEYLSFFYIFSFSVPSASVIPPDGVHTELFFEGDDPASTKCNDAQVVFRRRIIEFLGESQEGTPEVTQWARNIET